MNERQISYRCCSNQTVFLITYQISQDKAYHVCEACMKLPEYSRGIKNKQEIDEVAKPIQSQTETTELTEVT